MKNKIYCEVCRLPFIHRKQPEKGQENAGLRIPKLRFAIARKILLGCVVTPSMKTKNWLLRV